MPARTYKSTFIITKFEKILLKTTAPLTFVFLPAGKQTHTYTCMCPRLIISDKMLDEMVWTEG